MSLDLLRHNVRKRLALKIDTAIRLVTNQVFRPAHETSSGSIMPPETLEEIAVKTLTMNAAAKAFQEALDVIDEEIKKIVDPKSEQPPEPQPGDDEPTY